MPQERHHERTPTAPGRTEDDGFVLCAALELAKARWQVAVRLPDGRVARHALAGGDVAGLLRLLHRLAGGAPIRTCYEAGRDGFWLHRALEAAGVGNTVFDAASILVDRRARRAKTDRLDALLLLEALEELSRGRPGRGRPVRVPSLAAEDARRRHRERERLVRERTQHLARLRGLVWLHGVRAIDLRPRGREERLAALGLPPRLGAEVLRTHRRLALVEAMVAEVEEEARAELDAAADAAGRAAPAGEVDAMRRLMRLKGVGPVSARVLVHEAFWRDFGDRRQVASYFGLAPTPYASGGLRRELGISKAGNPRARTAAIELAWMWLHWQPQSALARWFAERTRGAGSRVRRVAIVAVARRLMIALWRYLAAGVVPEGAVAR